CQRRQAETECPLNALSPIELIEADAQEVAMRFFIESLLMTALLLMSVGLSAQEVFHSHDPDLFARLSYDSSPAVQKDEVRHLCVAISLNGDYRLVRSLTPERTQRLHGKMSEQQFEQLKALLSSSDFRDIVGSRGGL